MGGRGASPAMQTSSISSRRCWLSLLCCHTLSLAAGLLACFLGCCCCCCCCYCCCPIPCFFGVIYSICVLCFGVFFKNVSVTVRRWCFRNCPPVAKLCLRVDALLLYLNGVPYLPVFEVCSWRIPSWQTLRSHRVKVAPM